MINTSKDKRRKELTDIYAFVSSQSSDLSVISNIQVYVKIQLRRKEDFHGKLGEGNNYTTKVFNVRLYRFFVCSDDSVFWRYDQGKDSIK
jgi:hypothetical protein